MLGSAWKKWCSVLVTQSKEDTRAMADSAVEEREKLMNDYRTKIKEHMEMEAK